MLTFNFTYISMPGNKPDNLSQMTSKWMLVHLDLFNQSNLEAEWEAYGYRPDLDYSSTERSTLFMAVAVGALVAVFPMTLMLNKFGSR